MHTVGAFEAKAKIAELLDKVAAGETVLITRRGEAAALLVSPHPDCTEQVTRAVGRIYSSYLAICCKPLILNRQRERV